MNQMVLTASDLDIGAVDAAMRAAFGEAISGLSIWPDDEIVHVLFYDQYTAADEVAAQAIVDKVNNLASSRAYTGMITDDEWMTGLATTWEE